MAQLLHVEFPQIWYCEFHSTIHTIIEKNRNNSGLFGYAMLVHDLEKTFELWRLTSSYVIFASFQALLFGGNDHLPSFLARQTLPGLDTVVDPCAAILVLIVTALLCMGIKEVY